jgi:hypothetical protein
MFRIVRQPSLFVLGLTLLALGAAPAIAQEEEHSFIGTKGCKKCHLKEFKSWEQTKMAQAYESLKPGVDTEIKTELGLDPEADYTTDESCVACHVTGWGKPGGFTSVEETPELVGISCESCHGAGSSYTQDHLMSLKNKEYKLSEVVAAGMVEKVSEAQCVDCHNENVPIEGYTFDYEAVKDQGMHENFPLKYNHDG